MSATGGKKAIVAAFSANLGIAIAKFVAFVLTGSSALLAEGVHSLADTGNQALLLLGGRRSGRRADDEHPFGYGRERFFWAFVVALVLFSLGAMFAIYEGIHKLQHPEKPDNAVVAFVVLGVAVILEAYSFRTAMNESNALKRDLTWPQFIRRAKSPELPVVLLEDLGALAGLIVAAISLTLTVLVDPIWDGIGTVVIGLLLGAIAVVLAIEMKSLLIGESAAPEDVATITRIIESHPQVERLIHQRTEHVGPDEVLVAVKIAMAPASALTDIAESINDIEQQIRSAVPTSKWIYIEPDLARSSET